MAMSLADAAREYGSVEEWKPSNDFLAALAKGGKALQEWMENAKIPIPTGMGKNASSREMPLFQMLMGNPGRGIDRVAHGELPNMLPGFGGRMGRVAPLDPDLLDAAMLVGGAAGPVAKGVGRGTTAFVDSVGRELGNYSLRAPGGPMAQAGKVSVKGDTRPKVLVKLTDQFASPEAAAEVAATPVAAELKTKRAARRPPIPEDVRLSVEKANAELAASPHLSSVMPDAPEYWPWRDTKHGGYEAVWDDDKKKWFKQKITDPSEERLTKAVKDAEKYVFKDGNNVNVFPGELERPTQQGLTLDYSKPVNGVPAWKLDQYGEQFEAKAKELALRDAKGNPDAFKFYWTKHMEDGYKAAFGPETGAEAFQRWASRLGATTTGSKPPVNVRMATYHDVRDAYGLPIDPAPHYPYGHNRWNTHRGALEDLEANGGVYLDPKSQPKGSTFAGNTTGQTDAPTFDVIMSEGHELKTQTTPERVTASGKVLPAKEGTPISEPHENAYDVPVEKYRKVTNELRDTPLGDALPPEVREGLIASDIQSKNWAELGGDSAYAVPLQKHVSDRINVTARVTGLPVEEVKARFFKKVMPLLGAGGLTVAAINQAADEIEQGARQ